MMDLQEGTRLDPAVVMLWRLQRLVRTVVVGLPALIGLGFFASSVIRPELAAVLVVTLIAMKLVFALFWPSLTTTCSFNMECCFVGGLPYPTVESSTSTRDKGRWSASSGSLVSLSSRLQAAWRTPLFRG